MLTMPTAMMLTMMTTHMAGVATTIQDQCVKGCVFK